MDEMTRFKATMNNPTVPKHLCFRKPELDALTDEEFGRLPTIKAEPMCVAFHMGKVVDDDADLTRDRYINELRRRLSPRGEAGGEKPTPRSEVDQRDLEIEGRAQGRREQG